MASNAPDAAPPDRGDRRAWLWLVGLMTVAACLVLFGLDGGRIRVHDEGLYGRLARNALEYGEYSFAVDDDGSFYPGFSKPPLSIAVVAASFHGLGVSMTALRLPFALCMLGLVAVSFGWGRRIGGLPFGVAWGAVTLSCAATVRWGRVACIEPMLMLWIVLGLWAYHEAMLRTGRKALAWALLAGVALALAVATKQVVVALAVIPILALELWRGQWRAALPRLVPTLGLPTLLGGAWAWSAYRVLGDEAIEVYVGTGITRRLEGYASGNLSRTLNELSGVVAEACDPFPWVLGVAGLTVLVLARPLDRQRADGSLLLPLLLLTTVLVYENASRSMLPWYAFDLVVPLAGGMGFLVAGLLEPVSDRLSTVRAAGGALTLAVGAVGSLSRIVSQLDVALIVAVVVVVLWRRRVDQTREPEVSPGTRVLVAGAGVAFVVGAALRPELHTPPAGHEQLMRTLAARGLSVVHVDEDTHINGDHARSTYYGPHATEVTRPPWRAREDAEVYVTGLVWPVEWVPDSGSEVLRVPGAMALVGNLDQPAWGRDTMERLLDAGPISFEAEHLPSQRVDVVVDDPSASGGAARAVVPRFGRGEPAFLLTHGPGVRLPKGRYTAEFLLRVQCAGERPAASVVVVSSRKALRKTDVPCDELDPDEYQPVAVDFGLSRPSRIELRVQYLSGSVWHDRTVVRRQG